MTAFHLLNAVVEMLLLNAYASYMKENLIAIFVSLEVNIKSEIATMNRYKFM